MTRTSALASSQFMNDRPARIHKLNSQWHLPHRMRCAGEAWIVATNNRFDSIQRTLGDFAGGNEMLGGLENSTVHRQIVMTGGNDQIGPHHQPIIIDAIMMDERAARRFGDTDAFIAIRPGTGANLC